MKYLLGAIAATALAMPALAASPFDGAWKVDVSSAQFPTKPINILLKDGTYTCDCSTPTTVVKADGAFHAVTGHHYVDEIAVKIDDAHTVTETDKFKGKIVSKDTTVVSADGKTATDHWTDMSALNGKVVTGTGISKRVGPAPAGAHIASGAWVATKGDESANALISTIKLEGKKLTYNGATGERFEGLVGGPPGPVIGDPTQVMVQVSSPKPDTLLCAYTRDGKPLARTTWALAPDGKSILVTSVNIERGTTSTVTLRKQ